MALVFPSVQRARSRQMTAADPDFARARAFQTDRKRFQSDLTAATGQRSRARVSLISRARARIFRVWPAGESKLRARAGQPAGPLRAKMRKNECHLFVSRLAPQTKRVALGRARFNFATGHSARLQFAGKFDTTASALKMAGR